MINLALFNFTLKEAISKKIILSVFIIFSLIILLFSYVITLDFVDGMQAVFTSGDLILQGQLQLISQLPFFFLFIILIVLSSSFIPSMLEKGNIDVLLSKPISRESIIISKFFSVVSIVFILLSYLIGIIFLITSLKTGYWNFSFLYSIIWFTIIFAVMFSLMILTGIITRSSIISIIINFFLFFPITAILSPSKQDGNIKILEFISSDVVKSIIKFFYYILPKPWDLRELSDQFILGEKFNYQPLITSLLFAFVCLSASIYFFKKKDY